MVFRRQKFDLVNVRHDVETCLDFPFTMPRTQLTNLVIATFEQAMRWLLALLRSETLLAQNFSKRNAMRRRHVLPLALHTDGANDHDMFQMFFL